MLSSLLRDERELIGDGAAFVDLEERMSQRMAPTCDWTDMGSDAHFVQFFESDDFIVSEVSEYLLHGLMNGETCIAAATDEHLHGIGERIKKYSAGLNGNKGAGKYIALDAHETLGQILTGGIPDEKKFDDVIGNMVRKAAEAGSGVRIFGEMVGLLCFDQKYDSAVELESMWNRLRKAHSFSLFCGYSLGDLNRSGCGDTMSAICSGHTNVIPTESYSALQGTKERLKHIAMLQQRNRELEAEVLELEQRIAAKQTIAGLAPSIA